MSAMPALFFWMEYEEPYGALSQWYACTFTHESVVYRSAEMWMMVQKAVLFGDEETAQKIRDAATPDEQKKLGRQAKNFDRNKWHLNKSRIVEEGNFLKFTADEALKKLLLDTGERELVEASPEDRIWGVGFGAADAEANREAWGENLLGKALMNVRRRIRMQESEA